MKRIPWIDDLKGLAIVLIVAGHVVATLENMTTGECQAMFRGVFKFIYSFHVPLWFVIAGMTFSNRDGYATFAAKKFKRLMIPYYFWGLLSAVAYIVMGQDVAADVQAVSTTNSFAMKTLHGAWWVPIVSIVHAGGWPDGKGFCFNGVLWFLPVLFVTELVYYWIARLCEKAAPSYLLAASSFLAVFLLLESPLIYGLNLPFNLTWVPKFLPYMALGHWFSQRFLRSGGVVGGWLGYVIAGTLAAVVGIIAIVPIAGFEGASYYAKWLFHALLMIVIVMAIAYLKGFHYLGLFAPMTIGIMLFHKFPLVLAQIILGRLQLPAKDHLFPMTIGCFVLTFVLVLVCWGISRMIVKFLPWSLGVWDNPKELNGKCA